MKKKRTEADQKPHLAGSVGAGVTVAGSVKGLRSSCQIGAAEYRQRGQPTRARS